ncbi:hypothetical protein ACFT2C_02375 [Promicromonospora sp. NPDC057138]|uniref:hypothetical protein n=1 Tax=Promicromonospora sp. NPDC057138 TaxID=3346031 RepID=UPI003642B134
MFFARWLLTVLAFPAGGWLAIQTVGSNEGPLSAAVGGLLAGAVIGVAQWLALRSRGFGPRWAIGTAAGTAVGSALAAVLTGAGTSVGALVLTGSVIGAFVGAGQATQLGRGPRTATAWTALVSVTWAVGWLISGNVIVDAERGYYVFGLSGAVLATVATGLALRLILAKRPTPPRTDDPSSTTAPVAATR